MISFILILLENFEIKTLFLMPSQKQEVWLCKVMSTVQNTHLKVIYFFKIKKTVIMDAMYSLNAREMGLALPEPIVPDLLSPHGSPYLWGLGVGLGEK